MHHITAAIFSFITDLISSGGYPIVVFLMALESMIVPIPSEAVMPFTGYLITTGRFTFLGVILSSTLGSLIGSWLSYEAGKYGGRPLVEKYGKYLFLNRHHLDWTENFFKKYGDKTVFVSRFIPIVRHLISIPAGMGEMNRKKFVISTVLGAGMWNAILMYAGYAFGTHWEEAERYAGAFNNVLRILVVVGILYFLYTKRAWWQKRKHI